MKQVDTRISCDGPEYLLGTILALRTVNGFLYNSSLQGFVRSGVKKELDNVVLAVSSREVKRRFALDTETASHFGRSIHVGCGIDVRTSFDQHADDLGVLLHLVLLTRIAEAGSIQGCLRILRPLRVYIVKAGDGAPQGRPSIARGVSPWLRAQPKAGGRAAITN